MLGIVPGVTPQNIKSLVLATDNVREVANMSEGELAPLVGREAGRKIFGFFHRNVVED
ncbi:DNA repair protein rad16 [Verticillium alfalfae VaMs.102]|uniref:DNA repair protein rad16 n=1 Tax=Verticillium alfalfae (strain VaMs.102 / ATCC MYA-4576 / FGSC 10136) TaxID=526221 RepID=C9SB97_VERA1|nr:DNA repair protein rad16 [Verticillium alfalfae VaMs.102]EEY15647.1 DNA repair protein rad16 [Verticillium alfalfae VaMs.102]